ncbi:ABC transporter ATP-binding protein [Metallibacterium scheffleri]|uniref:ABC transporter ATP-binding protein n=1 Tax=Metallibacterium scheffleri TaxID=993689 RepID=UPI0018D406E5|nr:ABC transporter ATP-binding protein [Metallibacterium scheffleri]
MEPRSHHAARLHRRDALRRCQRTQGKTVPLLDIALGMDDQSTGRQNIRLRGLLLGMSDKEIRAKSEEIAEFTELGDYLDLPLRTRRPPPTRA